MGDTWCCSNILFLISVLSGMMIWSSYHIRSSSHLYFLNCRCTDGGRESFSFVLEIRVSNDSSSPCASCMAEMRSISTSARNPKNRSAAIMVWAGFGISAWSCLLDRASGLLDILPALYTILKLYEATIWCHLACLRFHCRASFQYVRFH